MATTTTTVFDAQVDTRVNQARLPNTVSRKVNYTKIPWTSTALTTGQTLSLCVLPPGAIPRPELSSVITTTDLTTQTLTLDIGTAENPDGWADGIDIAAIGQIPCVHLATTAAPAFLARTELAADSGKKYVEVYATFIIGSGALDAGELVYFILAWEDQG